MEDSTSSGVDESAVPLSLRVDAAYREWFELCRDGEKGGLEGFLAEQAEDVRPLLEERVHEHKRLTEIFQDKDQSFSPGVLVDGDFELIRELGAGSSAVVWEAHQRSLDRRIAIKFLQLSFALLSDRARDRFDREGRILGGIRHPGLISVYASGNYGSIPYLVEELVEGSKTLDELLKLHADEVKEGQRFGEQYDRKVAAWFLDISNAMAIVHEKGIYHRDVKPANLLIGGDGRARVIDFGLGQMDDQMEISRVGELLGTPMYMSPEQFNGHTDAQSDMFSLGVSLYESLTFQPPFYADAVALVRKKVESVDIPDPRTVRARIPGDLVTIQRKMTEKNPAHRYADMAAVAADLDAFLAGEPISAVPPRRLQVAWRWLRRRPQLLAGVGVGMTLAVALASLVYVASVRLKEENRQLDVELSESAEELANAEIQRLLTKFELEPVFFELDDNAPPGEPQFQLSADGEVLYELCGEGSLASIEVRAKGYHRLIDAHIEYFLHQEAKELVMEIERLEMTDKDLGEFPVYYKSIIEFEEGQYHNAIRGLWRWLTNYEKRSKVLYGKFSDPFTSPLDSRRTQAELRDLEERREGVLAELLIVALRGDLEGELLKFRRQIDDPERYLEQSRAELGSYLPPSHPRMMKIGLAKGLLLVHHKQYPEAEEFLGREYRRAIENERLGLANHPLTRNLQLEWARMLARTGDYEGAVLQMEQLLAWWTKISNSEPGQEHINTLIPRWRLGWVNLEYFFHTDADKQPEKRAALMERSLTLYEGVVEQMEETFGSDNLNTLQAKTGYGILLTILGRSDESIAMAKESYAQKKETLGLYSISTLISLRALYEAVGDMAKALKEGGDLERAAELYREVADLQLQAVESQMVRVQNQHESDLSQGAAFQSLADLDAGYCDYELASEFVRFGGLLTERGEYYLDPTMLSRIRSAAGELARLKGNPIWKHEESIAEAKGQVSVFLREYDLTEEGQAVADELEEASGK